MGLKWMWMWIFTVRVRGIGSQPEEWLGQIKGIGILYVCGAVGGVI